MTDDIDFNDASHVLHCARKVLDFCGLPQASEQLVHSQRILLGGISSDDERILAKLPPADEVVSDFVGRHDELRKLQEWIAHDKSNRWALSGDGGKGKSAIAYAFARQIACRTDHGFDAILWISAKRRRFVEGETILVDRPDFTDKSSAARAIIELFGDSPAEDPSMNEQHAIDLLTDFPSLVIADDIDTCEGEGDDAIQFLVMSIPALTDSKVLITSRTRLSGMSNITTPVSGLTPQDGEAFIRSRCDLMGMPMAPVLAFRERILEVTDSSPLYIEDMLRLAQCGVTVEEAIGLWEERGMEARKYALKREYDRLPEDAKQILLAIALQGPCNFELLCQGLDWPKLRGLNALQELQKMFLMPKSPKPTSLGVLALNRNVKSLVIDVFRNTAKYHRTERLMKAASGQLRTKRSENQHVEMVLSKARLLANRYRGEEATSLLREACEQYPGRCDVFANLAWVHKREKRNAEARECFKRAHELGCRVRDAYWHWSDLEAGEEEWRASADAATLGLDKFPDDQGLLFRLGYALHRQGRELIVEDGSPDGQKVCRKAEAILKKALLVSNTEERNFCLRSQIHRSIVLNYEALNDGGALARQVAQWGKECPNDRTRSTEEQRLREKYPQFLRKHVLPQDTDP